MARTPLSSAAGPAAIVSAAAGCLGLLLAPLPVWTLAALPLLPLAIGLGVIGLTGRNAWKKVLAVVGLVTGLGAAALIVAVAISLQYSPYRV